MSLSTALSLETLTPDALFAASERDLCELWTYYDANGDGLIQFEVRRERGSSSCKARSGAAG